jgi:putative hemolysin
MKYVLGFIFLICLLIIIYNVWLKTRNKAETNKVIKMSERRRRGSEKPKTQACSLCRKKGIRLTFYSSEQGNVIGVCDKCKPQAERRALMRL